MGWIGPWRCKRCGPASASLQRVSATWLAGSRHPRSWSTAPKALASGTWTAASTSTSPAGSAARTPAMASPLQSRRSTSRSTATCTSASWSGCTSRTSRSAAASQSSRPARATEQRSILVNSGAEAIENAVKVARAATGRPAVVVFDHAFHGRTLLTMTMTSKVAYRRGFGPFAPEVYRAPGPYPYRGVGTDEAIAGLELLFAREVDPESVACVVLEPVQGEGGFIVMPDDFPRALKEICEPARDPLRRRRGADRRRAHRPRLGDRALRHRAGPARLRQVARRRAAARRSDG